MIFLYTLILVLLGGIKWLVTRRAASLERKYSRVAAAVLKLANEPSIKLGNSARSEPCAYAQRTLELALLAHQRDRLEHKCIGWRGWADKLGRTLSWVREWKGKKLPYSMGVLDVWLVLYVIDRMGVGDSLSPRQVVENLIAWLGW